MPNPPAAFSPLTTTRSSFQSAIRPGRRLSTIARPLRPTISPTNRMRTVSPLPARDRLALGQHEIETRVVRQRRHCIDLLHRVGKPEGDDRLLGAQCMEGEIVIAGSIADPAAAAIERRERHDQDIGVKLVRVRLGLADAPLAALELLAE